jgi:soluble lytic murein transglycosylase-like protein
MVTELKEIGATYFKIYHKTALICLLMISVNIFYLNGAYAKTFIRIYKHGVIYYYFSDKCKLSSSRTNKTRVRSRSLINHSQIHNKISAREIEPWIKWASQNHKLPSALIKAVIRVESDFNPSATSPKGAQGLMQLMPGTAKDLQVTNPYGIRENIWGGTRYLEMLLKRFDNNLVLALAAYNAGPNTVEKCHSIPNIKETQGFVRNVCANFVHYSKETCLPR